MEKTQTKCSRCPGAMHEGFVVDTGLYATGVANWYAGPPKMRSFGRGIELVGSQLKRVTAYRCEQCGCLELFAP